MKKFRLFIAAMYLLSIAVAPVTSIAASVPNQKAATTQKVVKASLNLKNSEIGINDKWTPSANFVSATDAKGNKLDWNAISNSVKIEGAVDTTRAGSYSITYVWNNIRQVATVKVVEKSKPVTKVPVKPAEVKPAPPKEKKEIVPTSIKVSNSQLNVGQAWSAENNFISVVMSDGSELPWLEVMKQTQVSGAVDTSKAGENKVTYTYNGISATAIITVKAVEVVKVQEVKVKDSSLNVGDKWEAKDNFVSVVMSNGIELPWAEVAKQMQVSGTADTSKAGTYKVVYTYNGVSATATIIVKAVEAVKVQEVRVKNSTLDVGSKWEAKDNFVSVMMSNGTELSWAEVVKQMQITGTVDTKKAGTYKVTYTYNGVSATATVTVKAVEVVKVQEVKVKNSTLNVGDKWEAKDNFVSVVMSNGTELSWAEVVKQMQITGSVNTKKAGVYKVKYTYNGVSATASITVKKADKVDVKEVSVKDTTINLGNKWEAKDNFNYVLMTDGSKLNWLETMKQMQIEGKVDTQKAGKYKVTYNYLGKSATATVTVKNMEDIKVQQVSVKNTILYVGDKWEAKDNFNYVMMSNGIKLSWPDVVKQIQVSGTVDTSKPDTYKVTYNYLGQTATAQITVKSKVTGTGTVKPPVKPVKPVKPTLPQTGEASGIATIVLGVLLVAFTFMVITFKIKKEEI